MRTAGYLLPFSLLLAAACSSTPEDQTSGQLYETVTDPSGTDAPESSEGESSAQSVEQDDSAALAQEARQLSLQEQKRVFLVQQHIANARELQAQLQLQEAKEEVARALMLDGDNLEAKRLAADISGQLGEAPGEATVLAEQVAGQFALRVQQLKAEAEDLLRSGKIAMGRGDYDAAIAKLTLCESHIAWAPYSVDWGGVDTEASALLERAKADRVASAEAKRLQNQADSRMALQAAEAQETNRRDYIVANILTQAIEAFEAADYDEAMDFADKVLRKDPHNKQAAELRSTAFRAGRRGVRADYIAAKREQFARWHEDMDAKRIPWTDVITLPDPEDWNEITRTRSRRRGLDLSKKISASDLALRASLRENRIVLPGIEEEESLRAIIDTIRRYTGLPLVVDPAAEDAVLDEGIVFNFNFPNRITVEQALNLITRDAGEDVTWIIRHDAVLVTTTEKAQGTPVPYNHDVGDLIFGLTDFTGPRIDRLRLLDELEDDDGGGPFGGILESERLIEIEDLVTLIQENVAPETWDSSDSIRIEPGENFIMVTHSAAVQQAIKIFLEDLRRFNSSLVTIESKFMTVGDNWIQEIGVDFRGLDNVEVTDVTNGLEDMASLGLDNGGTGAEGQGAAGPPSGGFYYDDGEDGDFRGTSQNFFNDALGSSLSTIGGLTFQLNFINDLQLSTILRAVEKSSSYELVNSQILSVHNTQRAYVTVINQQAYIQDFDVEVAQFQAVADPQINVLHEGVVLDVRPTIHQNRRYLTLEIQPTVAKVIALRNFSSTLGGNTSPVEFQLPELEVQSVNTSALVPDGGSILLGGLSSIRNIERRAEVPWLARIPILGFLFKSEGYNDEKQSLMIMIRARINDVRERVAEELESQY